VRPSVVEPRELLIGGANARSASASPSLGIVPAAPAAAGVTSAPWA